MRSVFLLSLPLSSDSASACVCVCVCVHAYIRTSLCASLCLCVCVVYEPCGDLCSLKQIKSGVGHVWIYSMFEAVNLGQAQWEGRPERQSDSKRMLQYIHLGNIRKHELMKKKLPGLSPKASKKKYQIPYILWNTLFSFILSMLFIHIHKSVHTKMTS